MACLRMGYTVRISLGIMALILNLVLMFYYNNQILNHAKSPAVKVEVLALHGERFDRSFVSTTMCVHRIEETENQSVFYFFGDAGELAKTIVPKGTVWVRKGQLISVLGVWDDNHKSVVADKIYVHELEPTVPFYVSMPALPILLFFFFRDWSFSFKELSFGRRVHGNA